MNMILKPDCTHVTCTSLSDFEDKIWGIADKKPYKVWDEITYPFLNFNGCTVEV